MDVIPPLPWQNYSATSMAELPKACNGGEAKPVLPWLASPSGDTAGGVRTWFCGDGKAQVSRSG